MKAQLPDFLLERYDLLKKDIAKRLDDFAAVPAEEYFYELCYCLCTPQSKAVNAFAVVEKLKEGNFRETGFDPTEILSDRRHYIRFHNQKAKRLLAAREIFPKVTNILNSEKDVFEKRLLLTEAINGFGMKESSHYLRNIGYRNIAILDRHILKHLVQCAVYKEAPKVSSVKSYIETETKFRRFAKSTGIDMDVLDILFWSYESGIILK